MLTDPLLLFIIAALVSFAGSLQPGPVNLAVIHTCLNADIRKAMVVAVGGVIPEIIYSSLGIWFSLFIMTHQWLNEILQILAIITFLAIGFIFIFKKEQKKEVIFEQGKGKLFAIGFISGFLNPMMFPFWLMVASLINNSGYTVIDNLPSQIGFVAGTAAGAFALLFVSARIAQRQRKKIFSLFKGRFNLLMGIIFIILATWESFKLLSQL